LRRPSVRAGCSWPACSPPRAAREGRGPAAGGPSSPLSFAGAPGLGEVVDLDDERVLQEVGIYRYHHPLANSEAFRDRLKELQERIKDTVKQGQAIEASDMFTFNNSLAKGRKMTLDLSTLMLRAYNAEADNCVRSLRAGNVLTAKKRLEASVASIARLGAMMEMKISADYHGLRFEELELTADYLMKVQEEKEVARGERARLREERKVEQELAGERERLDKERSHFRNALEALRVNGDDAGVAELEEKLGLDLLVRFRNANAHSNESLLQGLVAGGDIKATLTSFRVYRRC
jgi:hypothetical protein